MYDIIIIGGGPAGLTAALYALRAEKSVLVLEKMGLGGQIALTDRVENFPGIAEISGFDFAEALSGQVKSLGGEIKYENVVEIRPGKEKIVVTPKNEYTAKSVIIATGVKNRLIGAEGEEKLIGRGISYCAVCDGSFYRGKTVAVIGGGNTALQDAEYLSQIATKVYLIHRRSEFRAEERLVRKLKTLENVEFLLNTTVERFCGDQKLSGLDLISTSDGKTRHIDLDGAFVAVGKVPQNEGFKGLVSLSDGGYVVAGEDCLTSVEGIFAAGDCRIKDVRQLTTAVGDGSVAALAASKYIDEKFA
ncbi:MAG: thioredoxin-disulfide reductase [Clostridia bacterium]|nr:thioredoxin-disulfide reductase [Clostridia bacterium]